MGGCKNIRVAIVARQNPANVAASAMILNRQSELKMRSRLASCQCIPRQRPWTGSETSRAIRSVLAPAEFPIQMWRSGSPRLRCKAPLVSPLVRESQPTIPLNAFPVRSTADNLTGALHATRQTQLPTLRARAATNQSMKFLSPWRANAAVCAPAFIKIAAPRQSRLPSPALNNYTAPRAGNGSRLSIMRADRIAGRFFRPACALRRS